MSKKTYVAIGDSFTFIDQYLFESGGRTKKGYVQRVADLLSFEVEVKHCAVNGGSTYTFTAIEPPVGDFYTILLGTNDWYGAAILGNEEDFKNRKFGTVLGHLGIIIDNIRKVAPKAPIFVCNPIERGQFVYIFDYKNNAYSSTHPNRNGVYLKEFANAIFTIVKGENIYTVNTHDETGLTSEGAMKYQVRLVNGEKKEMSFEEFDPLSVDATLPFYCYPEEAMGWATDGLHPNDKGYQIIASVIANHISKVVK
ncbi:MAG: SGNH/GDSL hydrolase family protein [Bacilli bacterium]|nr:SGNH/GDSL hydrolase family protein [Bacilli bacterium]